MEQFAYVRVSTKDQNIERQLMALEPYDIPGENIYCDYQSGKDFERPAYKEMIKRLQQGDLLIIKSIDRLGRTIMIFSCSGSVSPRRSALIFWYWIWIFWIPERETEI